MDRWTALFADLEAHLDAESEIDVHSAADELRRAEIARIALWQRFLGVKGSEVTLVTKGGVRFSGMVREAHPQWVLLTASGRDTIHPMTAITAVTGLGGAVPEESVYGTSPAQRKAREVSLVRMLRGLGERRAYVTVTAGQATEQGYLVDVLADSLDLAVRSTPSDTWSVERRQFSTVTIPLAPVEAIVVDGV
ncbi:hypothetical protein [Jonesia denitrificans]|uniref:Uncharacterized protein n=1 Tax=Jonesia denitrificans (strain ATCC 14870 / DSM 20603 / BCRC 15368 / CIP 55.134 / JCM 11481 / NBRC 15587 / NCTC 10816 / Prevot 55134) TaxID=471856 RepID=C7QZG4_JONDD|nr:hypothetical protein [Jonesia denitrificans]ACV09462.1 hypothetical protein Jden_1819 [Jonesia denitrificans DSM 20603]ASE09297.1 hypothetical protein CEP80_09200 [Jonesia denitrificans]QXB43840.1 hypothetical protein I6L70_02850 [Jonesia denitrificans]SQH21820.1 Uncharacterised protein [Jonesia denitrificans]